MQYLESTYFSFVFHEHDAQAVSTAAPRIDAFYATMVRNVGLTLPVAGNKRGIEVRVTHPSGNALHDVGRQGQLIVAAPARYQAPVALTDADLLVQAVVLTLSEELTKQVHEAYTVDAAWSPLVEALQLWQLWELDLPLAQWRTVIVKWLYGNLSSTNINQPATLPERYTEFCTLYKLWLPDPTQLRLPLLCTEAVDREQLFYERWPPIHLQELAVPVSGNHYPEAVSQMYLLNYAGQTVAQATLIEYAVQTYGRERLPDFLANLKRHQQWDTLMPRVFGVSSAEFEADWQTYLVTHYQASIHK